MKRVLAIWGLGVALSLQLEYTPSVFAQRASVSFGAFYDDLAPYGEWISCSGGVYGWRPGRVASDWRPYTVGRWCWTDDGWYWTSDEPWGWAAYHYGRWYYDDFSGWVWIPGYDWAPAWVEWRYGGDCIGWAPLSPYAVFNVNWGIHYRTRWYTPASYWTFVGCGYITSPNVCRYAYRTEENVRYIGVTRTAGSVRYDEGRIVTRGPGRDYVERRGNIRLETASIRDASGRGPERLIREGSREQIEAYRPRIQDGGAPVRPSHVRSGNERTLSLDTRKFDVRAREIAREEGRDLSRAEERRARMESERLRPDEQHNGLLRGPVDDATIRGRNGRSEPGERRSVDGRSGSQRPAEARPQGRPERRPEPQSERQRDRRREDTFRGPEFRQERREDVASRSENHNPGGGSERLRGGRGR